MARNLQLVKARETKDWLAHMIISVKAMAVISQSIPIPGVRTAFDATVSLLEAIEKSKGNRDSLRDLCTSTFEIVSILRTELEAHGQAAETPFDGLCESFVHLLHTLENDVVNMAKRRKGLRYRLMEIVTATSRADEIKRYHRRLNDLRANFILISTINTNLNVTAIGKRMSSRTLEQFRNVALGDINLLRESRLQNRAYALKVFTARISGEDSLKTVVEYGEEEEKWIKDLLHFSRFRHPHVWQLFGIVNATACRALSEESTELIPLPVFRQYHHPPSDLTWVLVEAMLFKEFKDCAQYHRWTGTDGSKSELASICVKTEPTRLCLAMPQALVNIEGVDWTQRILSRWHSPYYRNAKPLADINVCAVIAGYSLAPTTSSKRLALSLDLSAFLTTMIPAWFLFSIEPNLQTVLFLGTVAKMQYGDSSPCPGPLTPFGWIEHPEKIEIVPWKVGFYMSPSLCCVPLNETVMGSGWTRLTFGSASFKSDIMTRVEDPRTCRIASSVKIDESTRNTFHMSWLIQSQSYLPHEIPTNKYAYGVVDGLHCVLNINFRHQPTFRLEGTTQETHLFLCPVVTNTKGAGVGISFPQSNQFYWSSSPSGFPPLSAQECELVGLPSFAFSFEASLSMWQGYQYNALRDFT